MKKKIINGLLFAVAMVAATSSFVSCKDYEGDNYAEFQEKYAALQMAYDAQVKAMQDYVLTSKYESEVGKDYPTAKGVIKDRLQTLEDSIEAHQNYGNRLNVLEDSSEVYAQLIHENNIAIKKAQALAEDDSILIQKMILAWGKDLDEAVANAARVMTVTATVEADSAKWNAAYDSIVANSDDWNRALVLADSAWNYVRNTKKKDGKPFENLQDLTQYFEQADEALQSQIDSLKTDMNNILATLAKEVTGIEIQGTINPIYGTFAYPFGAQSNVLATYYGEIESSVTFPAGDGDPDQVMSWVGGTPAVLSSELEAIGAPSVTIPEGITMNEAIDNAGKLYVTVNPSNVDFTGKEFSLRSSNNNLSPVVLDSLKPCKDELKWGYQRRANSDNGFYVANAQIKKADVKDVALNFDFKSIGQQIKDIWNNWKDAKAADIAKLGMTILNGLQTDAPRLGVQAFWKDTTGWKRYVSKYDIAAVSAKPLGFDFLYNQNFSAPVVKFKNKLTAKERAYEKEIEALINIQIGLPKTAGNIVTEGDKVYLIVKKGDLGSIDPKQWTAVGTQLDGTPVQLPNGDYKMDISSLFDSINSSIAESTGNVKTKMQDILNKLINKQNKIFDKAISFASNPNRYIQPALIAESEALGFFYPSRIHTVPTQIKKGTKIKLYPTTMTAEVVSPAFKKYVAIVNAWDVNDMSKTTDAKQFNTGLNTIFDGSAYDAVSPIEYTVNAPAGTVLEFIYECLGYNGKIAGKKYYIEVYE